MNRRGFLTAVAAVPLAFALPRPKLAFHPDAFSMVTKALDPPTGIAISFIRRYDLVADQHPSAFDVYMVQKFRESGC